METYGGFGFYSDFLVLVNDYGTFRRIEFGKGIESEIKEEKELLGINRSSVK